MSFPKAVNRSQYYVTKRIRYNYLVIVLINELLLLDLKKKKEKKEENELLLLDLNLVFTRRSGAHIHPCTHHHRTPEKKARNEEQRGTSFRAAAKSARGSTQQ